jgi:hypothetical protein
MTHYFRRGEKTGGIDRRHFMNKKYSASSSTKLFSLGICQNALVINEDTLRISLFKEINISNIEKITYEKRSLGYSWSYFYVIQLKNGELKNIPYSTLEAYTFLELFNDLKTLNPNIHIDKEIFVILSKPKQKLKFNFNKPPKGKRISMDREFGQQNPSLDVFFGLTIVFSYIIIPAWFYLVSNSILIALHGIHFGDYRTVLFVLSGVFLTTFLMNLFVALASQYFGHKVTIIAGILTVIFFLIAVI